MSQSLASIEADEQLALEVNRQLNANTRRAIICSPAAISGHSKALQSKFAQRESVDSSRLPPTLISMVIAPVPAQNDPGSLSFSPLPVMSGVNDNTSNVDKPTTAVGCAPPHPTQPYIHEFSSVLQLSNSSGMAPTPGSSSTRNTHGNPYGVRGKPRGITSITISDADIRSVPLPGPELCKMVEQAKKQGKVPISYDSSVFRLVDGKWMAPQMCQSCQDTSKSERKNGKRACNRMFPCSSCITAGLNCQQGGLMILAVATKLSKQNFLVATSECQSRKISISPRHVAQDSAGSWVAELQSTQNLDSTWVLQSETQLPEDSPLYPYFITNNLSSRYKNRNEKIDDKYQSSIPDVHLRSHGIKRKTNQYDSDFTLELATPEKSSEICSSALTGTPPKRKKSAMNKKGGSAKYHESVQDDKPEPNGEPPIWADKRQNLCEALPYYRAYQSGAYINNGIVRGFMCDKEVGPRDKFDDEIMIARVGGGRKLDEESGKMVLKGDQDTSTFGLGFQRALDRKLPIAIIAGQSNRLSPSKLPHYYNVLDWFHVTDVWCEKSEGYKCWMVRLEKISLSMKSWWAPKESRLPDPNRIVCGYETNLAHCYFCKRPSKEIFNSGWACLEPSCRSFFQFDMNGETNSEIADNQLDYNEEFMKERRLFTGDSPPPLAPSLLSSKRIEEVDTFGSDSICKSGIVCPKCKACIRRVDWRQWRCETQGCHFTHEILQKTMKVHEAMSQSSILDTNYFDKEAGIRVRQQTMGPYDVFEYIIPGTRKDDAIGIIKHFRSNGVINPQPGGPNELFRKMQENDFGLKRHAARHKGLTNEVLTSHWAANWGAPYKYGVQVTSKAFKDAPLAIVRALKRLTWAGKQTVTENLEPFQPFNELLSIGYFEDTAIGYHDDGEKELGPTVATLSLGCQAVMKLRPKAKSGIGLDSKNKQGTKGDVLKILLCHGDMVVMHGSGIQKLYEHAVDPKGILRFALTCRYIRPELLIDDEERRQAAIKSELPDGHEQDEYDGDMNSTIVEVNNGSETIAETEKIVNTFCAAVQSGEVDPNTLERCYNLLHRYVKKGAIPTAIQSTSSEMEGVETTTSTGG